MTYRVLIAEERQTVRGFLAALVESSGQYTVAASLAQPEAAADWCSRHKAELVLFGVCTRRGESLLREAAALKAAFPQLRLVLVAVQPERLWLQLGKASGADGLLYLEDESQPLTVLQRVMAGERVFPATAPSVTVGAASSRDFTDRELQVLRQLQTGDGNIEIAARLGVRPDTVKFHLKSMLQKTGFHTRTALAVQAQAAGLTTVAAKPEKTSEKPNRPTQTGDV